MTDLLVIFGDIGVSGSHIDTGELYDIVVQIVDPCHLFCDSFWMVNDFEVHVDSIVTHIPSIYYENEDIANEISDVLKLDNMDILYNLVETILNFNNMHVNNDLLLSNLFLSSLYINRLFSLSISIPSEKYSMIDYFYNFDIFSIRVNNETINEKLSNITILIDNSDTNIGRNEFSNYDESFDCVDVIIIVMSNKNNNNNVESVLYNSTSNMTSSRAMINILSNQSRDDENNMYDLKENIVILFSDILEKHTNDNNNGQYHCVWDDNLNNIWDDYGCTTTILYNDIICDCDHLTAFAVIWHSDERHESDNLDQYSNSIVYSVLLFSLTCGFLTIAAFVIRLFYRLHTNNISPCDREKPYEPAYGALFFTFLQSIVQVNACLMLYVFISGLQNSDSFSDSDVIVEFFREFLTFSLLLPLIVSFYIFSHVIYGMAIIAVSISSRLAKKKKKFVRFAITGNVIVTLAFGLIIGSLVFDVNHIVVNEIFLISELIYIGFLVASVCLTIFYSVEATKIVYKSIQLSSNHVTAKIVKQKQAMMRIIIAAVCCGLFMIIQIVLTGYFSLYPKQFHVIFQLVDIACNMLFLIVIIYLYHHFVQAKIREKIEKGLWCN